MSALYSTRPLLSEANAGTSTVVPPTSSFVSMSKGDASVAKADGAITSTTSDASNKMALLTSSKAGDWGLSLIILFLVPLFFVKLSRALFPIKECPQMELSMEESNQLDREAKRQMDLQYVTVLSLGALGVVLAIVLAMTRLTSRSALLGLCYGSFVTLIFAVYTNFNRFGNVAQVSIIGVFLIGCLFLPRMTNEVLLK
jgi:hypothetical protein